MAKAEKVKKPFYKKWWVWVLAIIIIAAFSGGGGEVAEETSTSEQSNQKEEKASKKEEVASIGEAVKVGDVVFTVHGKETAKTIGDQYVSQDAQGTYLILDVTVKNEGKEAITTDSSFFKLKTGETTYESDGTADMYINDANNVFFLAQVNPGNETRGKIAFDVNDAVINATDTVVNVQTGVFGTEQAQIKIAE